jgi:hypothetical protein
MTETDIISVFRIYFYSPNIIVLSLNKQQRANQYQNDLRHLMSGQHKKSYFQPFHISFKWEKLQDLINVGENAKFGHE